MVGVVGAFVRGYVVGIGGGIGSTVRELEGGLEELPPTGLLRVGLVGLSIVGLQGEKV